MTDISLDKKACTMEETQPNNDFSNIHVQNLVYKAIKKKVLDSQAPPRPPKWLRIDPFFCV